MRLSQRLWDTYDDEALFDVTLDMIRKYPNSCDDVWLTTAVGYPTYENHKKHAERLIKAAKRFREAGVSVSLQVANTIGHGLYMCAYDVEGLVYDGSPVEHFVGSDGATSPYSYCPRGKHFRKYVNDTLAFYADVRPDCLWFDDDFRLLNHKPANEGCFCENCIAEFNTRYGTSFTREALVEEMLHGDKVWRERYLAFQREGMEEMMDESMRLFCEKSPNTVGGLQHAYTTPYVMGDLNFAFDPMLRNGADAPWSRPGGGTYNDHDPQKIIEKGIHVAHQISRLPDYVSETFPEIENIPHYAYGKSAEGTALETSYYLAVGATNMSYSMLKSTAEPPVYYEQFMKLFDEQRSYWEKLAAANRVTRPAGFAYFTSRDAWAMDIAPDAGIKALTSHVCMAADTGANRLFRDALPLTFDDRATGVYFLHPAEAKTMSMADIEKLLTKSVITDGETLVELARRGVHIGVRAEMIETMQALSLYEKYTDHPVNGEEKMWLSSFFVGGKKECSRLYDDTGRAEVIGTYTSDYETPYLKMGEDRNCGIAELVIETKQGGKWAIIGYQPWKGAISFARRNHLLALYDYLASAPLCARMTTPHQAVLHPRVDENGKTVCVSVTNCSISRLIGGTLCIRAPKGEKFLFCSQYASPVELSARREGDAYYLDLPEFAAWTQGTVFCE